MEDSLKILRNQRGQTAVEYLMLLSLTFIVAYIVVRGPVATFTSSMLVNIQQALTNIVSDAEWTTETITPGQGNSPSSPDRLRPLHL